MFGLGFTEILVVFVVALLVLGPEKLPQMARQLAKTLGELRRTADEIRRNFDEVNIEPDVHQAWQRTLEEASRLSQDMPKADEPKQLALPGMDAEHAMTEQEATKVTPLALGGELEAVEEPTSKVVMESEQVGQAATKSAHVSPAAQGEHTHKGSSDHDD